jgi:leucyl-tRNA synthetase
LAAPNAATDEYDPHSFESAWRAEWSGTNLYHAQAPEGRQRKRFVMEMFPYPSGDLHVGHIENYSIADLLARYSRMSGYQVLHPMGYDAFGLPAENAAISRGVNPWEWTLTNISSMRDSFGRLGCSFDERAEVITCEPEYYRWNQWIFLRLLERGLAYRKTSVVNWCPVDKTVLAKEQISTGVCWRCGTVPELRELPQWYLKITDYSDRLLDDMDQLQWPESVLRRQRAWIGRQHGAEVDFVVDGPDGPETVTVFTTRPDTGWGATFLLLAPDHPLAARFVAGTDAEQALADFADRTQRKGEVDRVSGRGGFTGMPLPVTAHNPFTGEAVPVWVADYVLADYGSGAVMAVPAHDQRDLDFARRYGLPVRVVVQPAGEPLDAGTMSEAYAGPGTLVASGPATGTMVDPDSGGGVRDVIRLVDEAGFGRASTQYRQRDWLVSRQRFWGTPIPVVYCDDCGMVPVPAEDLPVLLPDRMPVDPPAEGSSPLSADEAWVRAAVCPQCGGPARRETDTLDTFFDSSWYFLRYCSPHEDKVPFDTEAVRRWAPVDYYFGGMDHAVMHLIYARFFVKFFYDEGLLDFTEPFLRLFNQGWITFAGQQMSKSKGGGLTAAAILDGYGADAARVFILFCSPPEADYDFPKDGYELIGRVAYSWLARVWRILRHVAEEPVQPDLERTLHQTIKVVTEDLDAFRYNTAIARLMELVNAFSKLGRPVPRAAAEDFLRMLAPIAPFITEELWHRLGHDTSIHRERWPQYDRELAAADRVTLVVQVNGKVQDRMEVAADVAEADVWPLVSDRPRVQRALAGRAPTRIIVRAPKLVNIVL